MRDFGIYFKVKEDYCCGYDCLMLLRFGSVDSR